ncbi:MAG TPA: RNA-directed DNA polymerase [Blastocatellia bacterium]|nr:RNA-directed DNA polymerase [Blastocatellia bacterium]
MTWANADFITAQDLGLAYRRAKADLYYDGTHLKDFELCEYEDNLHENLGKLLTQLSLPALDWMTSPQFVGDWSVIPRDIAKDPNHKRRTGWIPSDPDKCWQARVKDSKPTAQFRLVGAHGIDFHVVSALWILKVGHLYDSALGPEAYGSRVARQYPQSTINQLSVGSFKPYAKQYGRWRDNGLKAMRRAVDDGKRVVAVTADARLFYHNISPDFLLHDAYLKDFVHLGDQLDHDSRRFTRALIDAIHAWASRTPLHRADSSRGVPVGLSASSLIANVALAELDHTIAREIAPLYYGRYVDDLMLVFEDTRDFSDDGAVWEFLRQRVGLEKVDENEGGTKFHRDYLGNSQIVFAGKKQKVFLLEGPTGSTLVETIQRQARARTSEWRALPDVDEKLGALEAHLLAAVNDDGEEVDNLREMDELSTRRQFLAFLLRDMEAFERDLPDAAWKDRRKAFWRVIIHSVIALPQLPTFARYLPRVFGLAIACRDYADARNLVRRLKKVLKMIRTDCSVMIAGDSTVDGDEPVRRWTSSLILALRAILAGAMKKHTRDAMQLQKVVLALEGLSDTPLDTAFLPSSWAPRMFCP